MNWQEIREQHPDSWVLMEAYGAYTENGKRIYPDLDVIGAFGNDSSAMWARYRELKERNRQREYIFYHTRNEVMDVEVLDRFGRKVTE